MYKLYSRLNDHETILECWGASTKHPDSVFHFSDFLLSEWFEPEAQIVPWLFECASKMNIPYHSYDLAKWACERYEEMRGFKQDLMLLINQFTMDKDDE